MVWDRGYSILDYTRGKGALRAAGVGGIVFDLATRQRTLQAIYPSIDFIDGVPFSKHMPQELRDLPRPPSETTPPPKSVRRRPRPSTDGPSGGSPPARHRA